jgi:hypothetical protein
MICWYYISRGRHAGRKLNGAEMPSTESHEYVIIEPHANEWHEDMRWIVTPGTKVVQQTGIKAGTVGTIVGQARARKADRIFRENLVRAANDGRELTSDDYGPLIENEGPLVRMADGSIEWFPGQSTGILAKYDEPEPPVENDEVSIEIQQAIFGNSPEVVAHALIDYENGLEPVGPFIEAVVKHLNEYLDNLNKYLSK